MSTLPPAALQMGSDMAFELFSHVTRFLGRTVVLLGLYNGQRLEGEPAEDLVSYSRVDEVSEGHAGAEGWRWGVAGLRIAALQGIVPAAGPACLLQAWQCMAFNPHVDPLCARCRPRMPGPTGVAGHTRPGRLPQGRSAALCACCCCGGGCRARC